MNNLQIFNYEGQEVRTVMVNDEPWWVLKDAADVLGVENHKDLRKRLDDDEVGRFDLPHPQSPAKSMSMICCNESGLYNVILRSDKPKAKPFRKWVTSEVLPAIRKHGAYMTPETLEQAILNPDIIIKIATALKEEQDKNKVLQAKNSSLTVENAIMQPKAEYFDELVDRNLLTNFRETAKQLQVKQNHFIIFLLDKKYLYRDQRGKLMPYAKYVDSGLFQLKEGFNEKTSWSGTQTLVTPKGRETFRLLYLQTA